MKLYFIKCVIFLQILRQGFNLSLTHSACTAVASMQKLLFVSGSSACLFAASFQCSAQFRYALPFFTCFRTIGTEFSPHYIYVSLSTVLKFGFVCMFVCLNFQTGVSNLSSSSLALLHCTSRRKAVTSTFGTARFVSFANGTGRTKQWGQFVIDCLIVVLHFTVRINQFLLSVMIIYPSISIRSVSSASKAKTRKCNVYNLPFVVSSCCNTETQRKEI